MPTGFYIKPRTLQRVGLDYSVQNSFPATPVPDPHIWAEGVQTEESTLCFSPTRFQDGLCLPRPAKDQLADSCGALRQYLPISIYAGFQGATYPLDRELALKAETVLLNGLEYELSLALHDLILFEFPTPVVPTAATPSCALASLVLALANVDGTAGGGWIYASWKTISLWSEEHLLHESGGKLYTIGGVEVVPGLQLGTETYAIAGGVPVFHVSDVVILDENADTIEETNTDAAIAELVYIAYWDPAPCAVFSVSVDCEA